MLRGYNLKKMSGVFVTEHKKPELLAPAGDMERLKFAYAYGADACYVGGESFSLRAGAGNFSLNELQDGIMLARKLKKKLYVAVNIFAHNADLPLLKKYLQELSVLSPHGLIVSDPGVFAFCREYAPNLPLHISTQANNTNWSTARFWREQGASRIVLARELSIVEAAEVTVEGGLETEVFVHGAMCMSYSGRCLLSSFLVGRDANQGDCTHPCRWNYRMFEEASRPGEYFALEEDARGSYIMNSKDLCLLRLLPELAAAGISSLKIEGRNKSVYYVANVTRIYRAALDALFAEKEKYYLRPEWQEELTKISHREYTEGFALGKPNQTAQRYAKGDYLRGYDFCGVVNQISDGLLHIEQRNNLRLGDELEILLPDATNLCLTLARMFDEEGNPIEVAPHPLQKITVPSDLFFNVPAIIRRRQR